MECTAARNWLSRKIDGELSDFENRELNVHLAQCTPCSREYRLLALPHRIGMAIPPAAPSPFFYQKLKLRIEGETQNVAGWQAFLGLARKMVPALAGVTLALLSVFAYVQMNGSEADIYGAYERISVSEDQSSRTLVAEQTEITDEGVLRAIAER